jgi:hypothetical protein
LAALIDRCIFNRHHRQHLRLLRHVNHVPKNRRLQLLGMFLLCSMTNRIQCPRSPLHLLQFRASCSPRPSPSRPKLPARLWETQLRGSHPCSGVCWARLPLPSGKPQPRRLTRICEAIVVGLPLYHDMDSYAQYRGSTVRSCCAKVPFCGFPNLPQRSRWDSRAYKTQVRA